jgi:hypothetical protein
MIRAEQVDRWRHLLAKAKCEIEEAIVDGLEESDRLDGEADEDDPETAGDVGAPDLAGLSIESIETLDDELHNAWLDLVREECR